MTGEKFPACQLSNNKPSHSQQNCFKPSSSLISRRSIPIPKGRSYYALAKHAEYLSKNLERAEFFYKKAILAGDRKESAIKDLAALMHQQGKTKDACEILEKFSKSFKSSPEKLENLYQALKRHLLTSPFSQKKKVKISGFPSKPSQCQVFSLFSNCSRIKKFEVEETGNCVFLEFNSKSSCRKTFDGFCGWESYKCAWVSGQNEFVAEMSKGKKGGVKSLDGDFEFRLFSRDPECWAFCIPIDGESADLQKDFVDVEERDVFGEGLVNVLGDTH